MGTTVAVIGFAYGAYAADQAGDAQEDLGNWNADVAAKQADDALARGRETERRQRIGIRQTIGAQRAAFAAQGVDVSDGSALEVVQDTAALGELDLITIRNNAAREAWGYRVGETDYRYKAQMAGYAGNQQAAGTILTGAASIARNYETA